MFTPISLSSIYGGRAPSYTTSRVSGIKPGVTSGTSTIRIDFSANTRATKRSSFIPEIPSEELPRHPSKPLYAYDGSTVYRLNAKAKEKQQVKSFCTGSKYIGDFNELGMAGKGIYKFPHGVIYDGNFNKKGEFHGTGILIYPGGQRVEGFWRDGKLVKGANFVSNNNAAFRPNLCKIPDRRFQIEVENDIMPAGLEYVTRDPKPQPIPFGCYDVGLGYYDVRKRIILDYKDPSKHKTLEEMTDEENFRLYETVLEKTYSYRCLLNQLSKRPIESRHNIHSVPPEELEYWITTNCRKGWDEPIGYRRDLYEIWTAGYRQRTDEEEDAMVLSRQSTETTDADDLIRRFSSVDPDPEVKDTSNNFYSFIRNKNKRFKRENAASSVSELVGILKLLGHDKRLSQIVTKTIFHYQKKHLSEGGDPSQMPVPKIKFDRYKLKLLMSPAHTWTNRKQITNRRTVTETALPDENK